MINHKISILIIIFLATTIIFTGILHQDENQYAPMDSWDSMHISASNSFREGKNFEFGYPRSSYNSLNQRYSNALQIYEQMISADKFYQDGWNGEIRISVKQDNLGELKKSLNELSQLYKKISTPTCELDYVVNCINQSADEMYLKTLNYVIQISNQQDFRAGKLLAYEEILKMETSNVDALINLGKLYEERELDGIAIRYYELALFITNDKYTKEQLNLKIKEKN